MSWMDLLRMSFSNLRRRKLRTFLTVLGVVIGTTSIVVMMSLGLGLEKSMFEEMEMSGGLTTITVTGADSYYYYGEDEMSDKHITDDVVEELNMLEHVVSAYPEYQMSALFIKGKYESWAELIALTPEGFAEQQLELTEDSKLPTTGTSTLELIYGNCILTNFYDKNGGSGYYETGELPDIDLRNDTLFMILDQDSYYSSMYGSDMGGDGMGSSGQTRKAKKHPVQACGLIDGGVEEYKVGSYNVYCDLDTLVKVLKKEFTGRAIPGQPTTESGKPYKDFAYSMVKVKVEKQDQVNEVVEQIRMMGYNASTNLEYMQSAKKQMAMIQAVLGGIGGVSLLVAAIGIANTMMMSIYERTKEIGIIKVLGCSLKNIKQMFLMEAAAIGFMGGTIGIILSLLISLGINIITGHGEMLGYSGDISYIPLWLILAAMGFSMLIGMIAGYFPALRAMRLSPLAAIKTE